MSEHRCDWVDAFTDRPLSGNGCAVVHDAAALDVETRLAFTKETGLTECAFVVPSTQADFGARYYLHHREILMAGHPTVATVASLRHRGMIPEGACEFTLEVGSGVLPISIDEAGWIEMVQAAPSFMEEHDRAEIAAIFGLRASDLLDEPQMVSTGSSFCITLVSQDALGQAELDVRKLRAWQEKLGEAGNMIEPYLVSLTTEGTMARLLLPPPGPPADAFTGSATGCAASYLWARGHLDGPDYVAAQGDDMGRPGRAKVGLIGTRDVIKGVRVAGQAHVLMSGVLRL
ncbi:PhzF family phenazine biosynthesis protein [Pontivivens insulae]|uniref:Putative isomerase YddE n=1 Tax=Pontivivens insulae TaxID=1639689 RepID=A0A2R8ACR3_9RHOB|nr:PhzF family phenazine biosynthesis protein [Pontivivens insulae]RED13754.1 PhzF family phenazine biosynthesis protein [Pontivivens insulae]SPF29828.1 putative isomerase YddE [Pontivivens insulae]